MMTSRTRVASGLAALLLLLLLLSLPATAQVRKTAADPKAAPDPRTALAGAWEGTDTPKPFRQVKFYTDTHFTWVVYQPADGKAIAVGGGTYTFDGKTLKELYVYGSGNIQEFVGKEPASFAIKFKGDEWTQDGKTPTGATVHETYRRAK